MRSDTTNGIEERTPKSECERDSYSSAKDSRRVSWNMIESDITAPLCYKNHHSNEGHFVPLIDASRRMTEQELILEPTRTAPSSTIEPEEIDAKAILGHRKHIGKTISFDVYKKNELVTKDCSMNMDTRTLHFSNCSASENLIEEEPMVIRQNLLRKISRLKQAIPTMQNYNSIQRGKSLIHEYQLRMELEAICEDVIFLGEKKDRLAEALRDLQSKSTKILMRNSEIKRNSNSNSTSEHEREREDDESARPHKTIEDTATRFSDACVQTEDWPTARDTSIDGAFTPIKSV